MSRKRLTVVIAASLTAACISVLAVAPTHTEYTGPPIPPEVALSNNAFAVDMYGQIAADPAHEGRNVFFSPFSLYTAASFLYEGARGETESQIERVFGFEPNDRTRHELMSNTSSSINRDDPHAALVTANALWLDKKFEPYQEYVDIVQDTYRADMDRLDFANDAPSSAKRINDWAGDRTRDKITQVVDERQVSKAAAVLSNAIYFKGLWGAQFDPADTHRGTFWRTPDDSVTADFMRVTASFDQAVSENAHILKMPYRGDRLSMLVFLPLERHGISGLDRAISAQSMGASGQLMTPLTTTVVMPKFEVETKYTFDEYLSGLGMPLAFDPAMADFSGMTDLTKQTENLFVRSAGQSAFVKVNEEGTEAAAVTTFVVGATSEPPEFIADHPFVFAIQDDASGAILFMGRMSDPTA